MTGTTVGDGHRIARAWLDAHASGIPGFAGAYTVGSINTLPDRAPLSPTSDVDVVVVVDAPEAPPKPGKMRRGGVLLEVTYLALEEVWEPERVLGHYHLAAGISSAQVLADPTGRLTELQSFVASSFARQEWVVRRCEMARDVVIQRLDSIHPDTPMDVQAMSWLFAAGGVPHILLVAALRNPTVRRRYEAVRALLFYYDEMDIYPELLAQFGARNLTDNQASHHLDALEGVFDAACAAIRPPFPFGSDITTEARPLAIEGSREMMARGRSREAMFWIAVTFTRCQQILHAGASGKTASCGDGAYLEMLADLGVDEPADLQRLAGRIRSSLPEVWKLAMRIAKASASAAD